MLGESKQSGVDIVERLLDQNDQLISILRDAVQGANPVGIIQALNPPWQPEEQLTQEPWETDHNHPPERTDPWADDQIPLERLKPGAGGWVGPEPEVEPEPEPEAASG